MKRNRVADVLTALKGAFEAKGWATRELRSLGETAQGRAPGARGGRQGVAGRADLDRVVQTQMAGRMSLGKVLHGVAAHDTYHGGQIRLLRTLL